MRRIVFVTSISALLFIVGCGGSSSKSSNGGSGGTTSVAGGNTIATSGNNVAPLTVDGGVANSTLNVPYTSVVVCAPGTSNCATFNHISVDTGSTGLRIPATAFPTVSNGAAVLAALQNVNPTTPVAECVQFLDNTLFWGTVKFADVKIGGTSNTGEVASSVPIHVIGDPSAPSIPSDCTGTEEDTITQLGENGRLGVGTYQYDCDVLGLPTGVGSNTFGIGASNACASSSTPPAATYYTCSSSSCSASSVPAPEQVRNPVSLFATDNNGVILELPSVPVGGQPGISAGQASMVFGIGTQANNGLGSAVVLTLDSNPNNADWQGITTVYKNVSYPNSTEDNTLLSNNLFTMGSFLDSGSNGIFFLDQPTSGIPSCGDWYCPSSTANLTAINKATGSNSNTVQFNVSNANTLLANNGGSDTAFSDLGGPNTSGAPTDSITLADDGYFDWGLPFFYGRNVYTAIWGVAPESGSSVPAGPFWAY